MRMSLHLVLLVLPVSLSAAAPDGVSLQLRTRAGDAAPVDTQVFLPFGSDQRLPAASSLTYHINVSSLLNGRAVAGLELNDASGNKLWKTDTDVALAPGETGSRSFTVCGDRVILQESVPVRPASCRDLPPMGKVDLRPDGCIECLGAYEGLPTRIESRARLAPAREAGDRLELTGQVLAPDGKPRAGVIVYAFQTDRAGIYPPSVPARSTFSDSHGRLRAWARTDARGRYTFDTIRPGAYPDGSEPPHIHMVVIEPGCSTYFIEDVHFADDPILAKVQPPYRDSLLNGRGGSGIVSTVRDVATGVLRATRDIELGRKFENYPGCSR
jgi:protocatechuate 3,4-dioxygenase beta subunit